MDFKKCLTIGVVVGIVVNVLDFVVQGNLLASYYSQPPFRQDNMVAWMVVGDFAAAFVFAWVYLKVAGSFASGPAGGATMGFYAGVLVSFPSGIFMHLMFQGFPYALSWIWIIYSTVWYIIAGAIAGALNKR